MSTTRVVPFERKVSFKADAEASVRRHGDGVKRSQRSLRRNLTFQTSSLKYASSRELNRPQLAPQRHTLKRNSSELWSGLFRSDSASKEKIVHAKTLLALQRYSQSHRLNTLDLQKRRLLPLKIALCVCALPVLFVHLRLRGNAAETDEDDYGQQGRNGDTCDLLKTIELALTAALLLLQIRDDYLHRRILHIVLQRQWLDFYGMALVQLLALCLGVLPPGIDAKIQIALTPEARAEGFDEVWLHVDAYCILQLLVRPVFVLLWMTTYLSPQVKSPAVLAWQHPECGQQVHPLFRVKYFFTRRPMSVIGIALLLVWVCGSLALYLVDPIYISAWSAFYDGWILLIDAPPRTPQTVLGQTIVMIMSFYGALSVAVVTAAMTASADLAPDEVRLVRTLEKQEEVRKREQSACMLLQSTVRLWHARHMQRRAARSKAVPSGSAGAAGSREGLGKVHDETQMTALVAKLQLAQHEATNPRSHET